MDKLHITLPEGWAGCEVRLTLKPRFFRKVAKLIGADGVVEVTQDMTGKCLCGQIAIDAQKEGYAAFTDNIQYSLYGHIDSGTASGEPSPTEYQQIISASLDAKQIAQSVRDDADTGKFDGADGAKGDPFTYEDFTAEQLAALKGEKGDKGDTGATGAKGETGAKGDAFTYSDFTAEQLASLKGEKGDTGAQGIQGIQGVQGEKGDTGATGAKGDKGDTGAQGADGAGVPAGGTTGQVLAKKTAADNDTEWIDPPSGGVQPDWNQNNTTAADYVKNRPFYIGCGDTVLAEQTVNTTNIFDTKYGDMTSITNLTLVGGETYIVKFDDCAYSCVAYSNYELGNSSLMSAEFADTGEPFAFAYEGQWIVLTNDTAPATHTIEIYKESVHTLPEKYLPIVGSIIFKSSTASSTKRFKITVDDSGTISATEVTG